MSTDRPFLGVMLMLCFLRAGPAGRQHCKGLGRHGDPDVAALVQGLLCKL